MNDVPATPADDLESFRYWRAIRRNLRLVLLVVGVALAAALVLVTLQSEVFRATTSFVVVQPGDRLVRSEIADIGLTQTVAGLATTVSVADDVIEQAGLDTTPEKFLKKLKVTVRPSASVVDITYDASSPEEATRVLGVLTDVFLSRVKTDLVATRASTTNSEALLEIKTFSPPRVLPEAVAPRPMRTLVIVGIVGLLIGVLLAFLRERLDDRVRDGDDAAQAFGAPVIGALPQGWMGQPPAIAGHAGAAGSWWSRLLVRLRLLSEEARRERVDEALQLLGLNVQALCGDTRGAVLTVTSTQPGEGKSTLVANLGVVLSRSGLNVMCVESDPAAPRLREFLNVDASMADDDAVVEVRMGGNAVVGTASGQGRLEVLLPADGGQTAGAAGDVDRLIAQLRAEADVVVFDASPLSQGDAHHLIRASDLVLLVARRRMTRRRRAARVRVILERLGVRRTAVVLTDAEAADAAG